MAEYFLDDTKVSPALQEMSRAAMSELVRRQAARIAYLPRQAR
jgi:hypothetical protein